MTTEAVRPLALYSIGGGIAFFVLTAVAFGSGSPLTYSGVSTAVSSASPEAGLPEPARHLPTPDPLKAIYMTSCVVGTLSFREKLVRIADETEINAIVIDVKDFSGTLSFKPQNPALLPAWEASKCGARDMREFVSSLHEKGIYVIARISVFQDPHLVSRHPDLAVLRASDNAVWRDRKGIAWLDAGSREAWTYTAAIGREAYELGFDELNFDYVRFPSDGNVRDIFFPHSRLRAPREVLGEFFAYLRAELAPLGAVISADLFGMTMTNYDDLNIGQVLEVALPYFDYIAPMVYPSHYPSGFLNLRRPAAEPYRVIKYSMDVGVSRALAASTTPYKLRPWLQDFDLGAEYTPAMVRAQMQATYDSGLSSWMLWDPSNTYTRAALNPETVQH